DAPVADLDPGPLGLFVSAGSAGDHARRVPARAGRQRANLRGAQCIHADRTDLRGPLLPHQRPPAGLLHHTPSKGPIRFGEGVYLSFVVLTSLGFGEIVPTSAVAGGSPSWKLSSGRCTWPCSWPGP